MIINKFLQLIDKKKKALFALIIAIAFIILLGVGSTFAYFSASIGSNENAVSFGAAEFQIEFTDDLDLLKSNVIPSIEEYVDIAVRRRDENGNFLKPYEVDGKTITDGTVCIDDNLNEICSVYTFTITNPMTTNDLPLYITLNQSMNTFENLYYKVLDSDLEEVIPATRIQDNRYLTDEKGNFILDGNDNRIPKENFDDLKLEPAVFTNINKTLPRTTDEENKSSVTYTIVLWIMETGDNQTDQDGGKLFASTLHVSASGADGKGITGVFSTSGVE